MGHKIQSLIVPGQAPPLRVEIDANAYVAGTT
jgi:hypothetical protein